MLRNVDLVYPAHKNFETAPRNIGHSWQDLTLWRDDKVWKILSKYAHICDRKSIRLVSCAHHMEIRGIWNPSSSHVNPYIRNETLVNGEWLSIRHENRHKRTYIKGGRRHWCKTRPQYRTHQRQNPQNMGIPTMAWHVTSSKQRLHSYFYYEYYVLFFQSWRILYFKAPYYELWSSLYCNLHIQVHTLEWIREVGLP